ncbi:MAG: LPS export ABC transporter periplasmic protein LptC [Candidatus Omnitrophica bacterium]|nr:LPS export ABC transporter periplasmic protein LptC [Candidatus Omnitrophota bacterium]
MGTGYSKLFSIGITAFVVGAVLFFFVFSGPRKSHGAVSSASAPPRALGEENHELHKFSLTGFDDHGKKFWNLEGETAKVDPSQSVYLDDHVTLRLKDDTVVRTDHLEWLPEKGRLRTPAPVYVDHPDIQIKGMGAFGKLNENFIQINRQIEVRIHQTTQLVCQGPMKIFYKENRISFYRKVKVTDERGVLTADRMEVFLDSKEKKVRQITAFGRVVVERGSDVTRAEKATYLVATGVVRLEGNPEIILNQTTAGGEDFNIGGSS